MAESDQANETRLAGRHLLGDRLRINAFGFSVNDLDCVATITCVAGNKPRPQRRLDRGQFSAQFLINALAPIGINEQQV